jgi:hypothetical protein
VETIIGFVVGYLIGSREGKAGLKRLQESWQAIRTSPEAHRLAADALSFAEAAARQASGRSVSAVGQGVVPAVAARSGSRQRAARAA